MQHAKRCQVDRSASMVVHIPPSLRLTTNGMRNDHVEASRIFLQAIPLMAATPTATRPIRLQQHQSHAAEISSCTSAQERKYHSVPVCLRHELVLGNSLMSVRRGVPTVMTCPNSTVGGETSIYTTQAR